MDEVKFNRKEVVQHLREPKLKHELKKQFE